MVEFPRCVEVGLVTQRQSCEAMDSVVFVMLHSNVDILLSSDEFRVPSELSAVPHGCVSFDFAVISSN